MHHHGQQSISPLAPRSTLYQGPYGRLFADLAPWPAQDLTDHEADLAFMALADGMIEREGLTPQQIAQAANDQQPPFVDTHADPDFDSTIPAGYTYFGQFVDHDITFDTASSLQRAADPNGLLNFRTPRLDLDNLYGRGRDDQPYMFDGPKFMLGTVLTDGAPVMVAGDGAPVPLLDLPRAGNGRAIIGDARNDENAIVSQLQVAFLCAHNTLAQRALDAGSSPDQAFDRARTTLRRLYQWVVWKDFLRRVCDKEVWAHALQVGDQDGGLAGRTTVNCGFDDVYSWRNQPYMPVEFSVAAYRFGHSMIRSEYRTNIRRGPFTHVPLFMQGGTDIDDLRGFEPMKELNAVEWDWFLQMDSSIAGAQFPQHAHKIDAKITNAVEMLPEIPAVLAMRNIKRGWRFGLPSGNAVARALGVAELDIAEDHDALWLHILMEAQEQAAGEHLGAVGSIIVASTFAGLLAGDPTSWLATDPGWTPEEEVGGGLLLASDRVDSDGVVDADGDPVEPWGLASIIRIAGVPSSAAHFGDVAAAEEPAPDAGAEPIEA